MLGSEWWTPGDLEADGTAASAGAPRGDAPRDRRDRGCGVSGTNEGKLWGGRFAGGPSPELEALSRSTHFDWRLGPLRHRAAPTPTPRRSPPPACSPPTEEAELHRGLDVLSDGFAAGTVVPDPSDEDVHGALERLLIEEVGADVGGKLRAGRSRNDQIATLFRCYLLDHSLTVGAPAARPGRRARRPGGDPPRRGSMPGRTHLQHAQPVLLSHHLLAHAWALLRDVDRLADWRRRVESDSPYGSGALAGQSLGSRPRAGRARAQLHRVDRQLDRRHRVARLRRGVRVRRRPGRRRHQPASPRR